MGTPRLDKLDKNVLLNGNFDIWQRGTSFAVSFGGTDNYYTSDRWVNTNYTSSGSFTMSQSTDVPSGLKNCRYSYKYQCTSNITFAGPDHHLFVGLQRIEGYVASKVFDKKVTLRFWVKSSVAGDYNALIGDAYGSAGARYLIPYTITSANTWQLVKKVVTIDTSYGVFANSNTEGLFISFPLAGGSSRQVSSLSTWLSSSTGEITAATNRTALLNSGATFYLAQISLTEGEDLNEYPYKSLNDDFLECQRYYETGHCKLYLSGTGVGKAITNMYRSWKRTTPVLSFSGSNQPTGTESNNQYFFQVIRSTADNEISFDFIADAEL